MSAWLLTATELAGLPGARVLDARFRLGKPEAAREAYLAGHLPGAPFLDLERDLSGAKTGRNGRHPLPERAALAALFFRLGVGADTPVVVYDDTDHAGAARAWMLLRWLGHERVGILDGGLRAWKEAGFPLETGEAAPVAAASFPLRAPLVRHVAREALGGRALVDARAPERYRGEVEPMDALAGHIPGARNLPYGSLLGTDGRFLPRPELARRLADAGPEPVFYCGSGVTACVTLFAAELTGRPASLYPGSWSEWSSQPNAPVAKGEEDK